MILQTEELSPNQKAGIENMGRKPQQKAASAADRQTAAEQMRYQLYLLDRSQHRMSIEDCMAALLEKSGTEFPA